MTICSIKDITIKPFERGQDKHIWFPVQIELDNHDKIEVYRRYSDFIRFYEQLQTIDKGTYLPLKMDNKKMYWIKRHQKYSQRQAELEKFCKYLLALPSAITNSDFYISFFNLDVSSDTSSSGSSSHGDSCTDLLRNETILEEEEDVIRIKLVYDAHNIIILRVPRSITFNELKSKIIQKFALLNINLSPHLVLLTLSNHQQQTSSASSITENVIVISSETHFVDAMQTQWLHDKKITARILSI